MGKGDIKTRRGKIINKSFGVKRPKNRKRKKRNIYPQKFEIVIIESLKANEQKTGKILYEDTIAYKILQEPNLSSSYQSINSKTEIIGCLKNVRQRIKKEKLFPILHIEAHGSERGLHLANGELLSWEELFNETREMNIMTHNALILNLALCHGVSLIRMLAPTERAPFRAIVTTSNEIKSGILLEGFEIFYNNFLFSFSGSESVKEANKALEKERGKFIFKKAEELIDDFTNANRDPIFFERMINDFAVKEKATNPKFKNLDFKEAYNYSKGKIMTLMEEIKNNRDYFLMKNIKRMN